jgi:hypothetical protein
MNNNNATMKETSKNCVSDYPLSNSTECGVKRGGGILQSERAVCCCGCAFLKWKSKSSRRPVSRWFGKGGISVTADVDVPDKVEKRIHLAEVRAKRKSKAFLLQDFWASRARARTARRSGEAYRWVGCLLLLNCDRAVKVSFGRVECREFARTVGDNEWVLFLCLWTGRC